MTFPFSITKGELLKHLLTGGALSVGTVIGFSIYEVVRAQPQMVLQLVNGWGPMAAIAIGGMLLVDRRFGQVLDVQRDSASVQRDSVAAHEKLANAVKELADRDDREREEQRRLLSVVGSQQEKILMKLEQIEPRVSARGAHAG